MTNFVERHRELLIEDALQRSARAEELSRSLRVALRVERGQHLGDVVELDSTTAIAEVRGTPFGTVWRLVSGGRAYAECYPSRWAAVLAAAGSQHGAGAEAWSYAARVLQVPVE